MSIPKHKVGSVARYEMGCRCDNCVYEKWISLHQIEGEPVAVTTRRAINAMREYPEKLEELRAPKLCAQDLNDDIRECGYEGDGI